MAILQQAQMKTANGHRKASPKYKVSDRVWLSTRNIYTERLSKKLDNKKISPYPITKLVESLYQLKLPASMHIHDVFHSNLLRLAAKNPLPGQYNDLLPPVIVNNEKK